MIRVGVVLRRRGGFGRGGNDEPGAWTAAYPAVPVGSYGWPLDDAARIAVNTALATPSRVDEARFVLISADVHVAFKVAVRGA